MYNAASLKVRTDMPQFLWYVRSKDGALGPFPQHQIEEFIMLGRLGVAGRVSRDRQLWLTVRECGFFDEALRSRELVVARTPQAEQGHQDWDQERALARQRWLDQRNDPQALEAGASEQRTGEAVTLMALRQDHVQTELLTRQASERKPAYWIAILALTAVALIAASVWYWQRQQGYSLTARLTARVDCAASPLAGVAWQGCDKRRADLTGAQLKGANLARARLDGAGLRGAVLDYANLQRASLRGVDLSHANLVGADLAGADLTGADLSGAVLDYANLRDALVEGTRFAGTRLGKATWTDGRLCAPQSVDGCG